MATRLRFNAAGQVFDAFPKVTSRDRPRPTDDETPIDFAPQAPRASGRLRRDRLHRRRAAAARGGLVGLPMRAGAERRQERRRASRRRSLGPQARGGRAPGRAADRRVGRHRRPDHLACARRRPLRRKHRARRRPPVACLGGGHRDEPQGRNHPRDRSAARGSRFRPWVRACVEAGMRFADGGDAKVTPPAVAEPRRLTS